MRTIFKSQIKEYIVTYILQCGPAMLQEYNIYMQYIYARYVSLALRHYTDLIAICT